MKYIGEMERIKDILEKKEKEKEEQRREEEERKMWELDKEIGAKTVRDTSTYLSNLIEDPTKSLEERGEASTFMQEASRKGMERQIKKEMLDKMMEDLRQKKLKRAEMLMKKYGKDSE